MAPRRLVMAAAVDEQVEVQLPFHRASPCRRLPPSPRWEGGRRIGNVCPGGQLRQDGYGLREVDVARQSSDAGRNPAGYFPRLPIRRRAELRYRPPRRGHKDLAVEVVDQLRGRNKSLTDSPAEQDGFELAVPPREGVASSRRGEGPEVYQDGFDRYRLAWGTSGSNPVSSSAESGTNRRPRVKRPFWIVTRAGAVEIGDEVFFEIVGHGF